jgi:hypothetical protein
VSVYRVYSVSIDNILVLICEVYSILYKEGCLGLAICACYSWEKELNVNPDVSFGNM